MYLSAVWSQLSVSSKMSRNIDKNKRHIPSEEGILQLSSDMKDVIPQRVLNSTHIHNCHPVVSY
jgi:hypothetical protein